MMSYWPQKRQKRLGVSSGVKWCQVLWRSVNCCQGVSRMLFTLRALLFVQLLVIAARMKILRGYVPPMHWSTAQWPIFQNFPAAQGLESGITIFILTLMSVTVHPCNELAVEASKNINLQLQQLPGRNSWLRLHLPPAALPLVIWHGPRCRGCEAATSTRGCGRSRPETRANSRRHRCQTWTCPQSWGLVMVCPQKPYPLTSSGSKGGSLGWSPQSHQASLDDSRRWKTTLGCLPRSRLKS